MPNECKWIITYSYLRSRNKTDLALITIDQVLRYYCGCAKKCAINGLLGGQITCYMYKQRDVILHAIRVFYFVSAIVWKERGRKLFLEIKVDGQLFGVQSPLLRALKVLFKTKSTKDFKNLNLHIRMRGLCLFPPSLI